MPHVYPLCLEQCHVCAHYTVMFTSQHTEALAVGGAVLLILCPKCSSISFDFATPQAHVDTPNSESQTEASAMSRLPHGTRQYRDNGNQGRQEFLRRGSR